MNEPLYFYSKSMLFWGLSNISPPGVEEDGVYWSTVEHYFHAQKCDDPIYREKIRRAETPKKARSLGQSRGITLRPDWDDVREQVMLDGLRKKFKVPKAKELLRSTGSRLLVEASPFDYFWACGQDGSGLNRLGVLLQVVRNEIREQS